MRITEEYKNNIKEIDKFIKTLSYSEESANRIRQFVNDPLSVLNDDIKALFEKYNDQIVDYRIPLPKEIISCKDNYPDEIYLVIATLTDCLLDDDVVNIYYDDETNEVTVTEVDISLDTICKNYFTVNNEKRKVWRYLDSKAISLAKNVYVKGLSAGNGTTTIDMAKDDCFKPYFACFAKYVLALGTRETLLKKKITDIVKRTDITLTGDANVDIKNIADILKEMFRITSEIIGAKLMDDKFKPYLSFNAFDWLLASTAEDFHSCIDMESNYCYGAGILGMCGCPDWGMVVYSDGSQKEYLGIKALHIITRSWVCYTNKKNWQIINWYPKDIRSSVTFKEDSTEDMKFRYGADDKIQSFSSWRPISFFNGGVSWIYSDLNQFIVNSDDKKKVHFSMTGRGGINGLCVNRESGEIGNGCANGIIPDLIHACHCSSIGDAVRGGIVIADKQKERDEMQDLHRCDCCGYNFESEDDLTWIESEEQYVCQNCLDEYYFWCEHCEGYVNRDDAIEVYYGRGDYDYSLVCRDCVENSDGFCWDDYSEKYYGSSVDFYTIYNKDGGEMWVSEFSRDELLENGEVAENGDGDYYFVEKKEEEKVNG